MSHKAPDAIPTLIIGAGGHGRVISEMIRRSKRLALVGFIDDQKPPGTPVEDSVVVGNTRQIPYLLASTSEERRRGPIGIVVGVGDNAARRQVVETLQEFIAAGAAQYVTVVDPSAVISSYSVLGEGTVVMPNVVVNTGTVVGAHSILNTASTIDHDCRLGDFTHISPGVHLSGAVSVGEGSHIGTGSSAIPGVQIGAWSVVGAGSVIVRDLPDYVVAYGVPARVQRKNTVRSQKQKE